MGDTPDKAKLGATRQRKPKKVPSNGANTSTPAWLLPKGLQGKGIVGVQWDAESLRDCSASPRPLLKKQEEWHGSEPWVLGAQLAGGNLSHIHGIPGLDVLCR